MPHWIAIGCTAAIELYVLRRLRFEWFLVVTVLAGLLIDANYLSYTSIYERSYDGPSHVLYVNELAESHRLPQVSVFCTACGHPPLYYALAALWSKTVLALGRVPSEFGLMWLSLLLSFGFVVFSLLLLRASLRGQATLRLAAALVVFWPSNILNSVRVHNDALASTLMMAAIYFCSQWDRHGRQRDFNWALITSALALLTKSSGYTVALALLTITALQLRAHHFSRQSKQNCAVAAFVLFGSASLAASFRESPHPRSLCQVVLGNACDMPSFVYGPRLLTNYTYFDVSDFVLFDSAKGHSGARRYFWSDLAQSCLFGGMPLGKDFGGAHYLRLAVMIRLLFLAMVATCVLALRFISPTVWRRYRAVIVASASMLAFLLAFHVIVPNPFHADFRHIAPLIVPLCLLYAKAVEHVNRWSHVLSKAGVVIGLLLVGVSAAFFVRVP